MTTLGFGLDANMFDTQRINFHSFTGNKNGNAKAHKFRVLPAYAPGKLFHKVGLHWGYRKADGSMKVLTCTLEEKGSCPICDKINLMKGQLETIEAGIATEFDPQKRAALETQKKEFSEYIGDHRRKPTYLWNILTEEGDQKVLQLSWNGHDPLFEKIKFIFSNQKIDVTSLESSQQMLCSRSGLMAKTRYQYELMPGMEKKVELSKLTDLSKVYSIESVEFLNKVIETEVVPTPSQDPNDRNFNAAPAAQQVAQPVAQPVTQPVQAPVAPTPVAQPVSPTPAPVTPAPTDSVNLNTAQKDSVEEMMAALNK